MPGLQLFSRLSPAEIERLALLSEELGEVQQAIGKIMRHGYESYHPDDPNTSNRAMLERELGDVNASIRMLASAQDIDMRSVGLHQKRKLKKVKQYLHHQPSGAL